MIAARRLAALALALILAGCAAPHIIVTPSGPIYDSKPTLVQEGTASWYGGRWIGRLTANGEHYHAEDITAAHKTLPFNTMVRVVDLKTKNTVIVRINNRGPYVKGRIIDLSVVAAKKLGTYDRGLAKVRIEALKEIPVMAKPNLRVKTKPVASTPATVATTHATPVKKSTASSSAAHTKSAKKSSASASSKTKHKHHRAVSSSNG